jgi:hypothetical protein
MRVFTLHCCFFELAMVLGAVAFSGRLCILSISISLAYILMAVLRFATAATSSAFEAVLFVGAQELTMAYSFLLGVMVLAINLLLLVPQGWLPV